MTAYVIRRVLWLIPLLWAVCTITFSLMHLVPAGPFDVQEKLPPAARANLERRYNLDKPIFPISFDGVAPEFHGQSQYGNFMWDLVVHQDLGTSFTQDRDVNEIITTGFKVSAQLGLMSFLFAITVGMGS